MDSRLFAFESVTEGHPAKTADQISSAPLDAFLAQDPASRVACETLATAGMALVSGEVTTECFVDVPGIGGMVTIIQELLPFVGPIAAPGPIPPPPGRIDPGTGQNTVRSWIPSKFRAPDITAESC